MSGIVGLFNLDGRPVTLRDLHLMAAGARRPAEGGARFWVSSSMGLGHQHGWAAIEEQPFVSSSGVAVSFDGRLDNRDDLRPPRQTEGPASPRIPSDAAYVSAVHEQAGEGFASQLNGDFAVALFDPSRYQLVLARDVMGARCLHYTQVGRTLLFASEIKSLLAYPGVCRAPDEDALADQILDRWVDPHRTCFRGIYSVPPGQQLLATSERISLRCHWEFDPTREIRYRTFDEYAECFRALFEQSVRRRIRSAYPVAVSVSGGLDSSSIFCQAATLSRRGPERPPIRGISMTFPAGSPADEQQFLDEIDAVSGSPVERVPITEIRVLPDAQKVVGDLERPELVWDTFPEVLTRARRAGCAVFLDGYFGDEVLFPRRYLVDLAHRGCWLKIRHDLREFGAWMNGESKYFNQEFRNTLARSMLPRKLFHAVKRSAARRRAARYPAWYNKGFVGRVLERQMTRFDSGHRFASRHAEECFRNATAGHYQFHAQRLSTAAAMHGLDLASPFRDRDLVAFLMGVPGEVVSWRGVPKGLLRQGLKEVLPAPIRDRRWKADFTLLANDAVLKDYDTIQRLLTPDSMSVAAGFVDGNVLKQTVANYKARIADDNDDATAGWRLTELAALELWLRHFFGGGACTTS